MLSVLKELNRLVCVKCGEERYDVCRECQIHKLINKIVEEI